jgi:hypothetical protein
MMKGELTRAEVEQILSSEFSDEEAEAIRLMRQQLRDHGVKGEERLTRMACEFAEVLLSGRR